MQKVTQFQRVQKDILGRSFVYHDYYNLSNSSRTSHGKIDVSTPHLHNYRNNSCDGLVQPDPVTNTAWPIASMQSARGFQRNSTLASALADHQRKAKGGETASLLMTASTWRQSLDMITGRLINIASRLHYAEQLLRSNKKRRAYLRRAAKRLKIPEAPPSLVLEGFFGWSPLFSDIRNGLEVLSRPLDDGWATGRKRATETFSEASIDRPGTNPSYVRSMNGWMRCTVSSRVVITNQNLWLANRLGLINPGATLWDRVPWSFVVNNFVNINQMISGLSDQVGVEHRDVSHTWSWDQKFESYEWTNRKYGKPYPTADSTRTIQRLIGRNRSIGGSLRPPLVLRLPDVGGSISFALIYSSLAMQRSQRIKYLLTI